MFKSNRKYLDVANRIGREVHRQIKRVLSVKGRSLSGADELVYITGYLQTFAFVGLANVGCTDLKKYIRHICNGVLPGKLSLSH